MNLDKNNEKRLKFYLGKHYDSKHVLIHSMGPSVKLKTIMEYYEQYKSNLVITRSYILPLYIFLKNNNLLHRKFLLQPGDRVGSSEITTWSLCKKIYDTFMFTKIRRINEEYNVILKCFNAKRHWGLCKQIKNFDIPFSEKMNTVVWRGASTGLTTHISSRFSLVNKWYNKCHDIDIGFSICCQNRDEFKKYVKGPMSVSNMLTHKYIVSVQGNDKDSGLNWKLSSNSLVMMAKPTVDSWLMESTLIPGYHYVLLSDDFSNLHDKVEWCNRNPDKCEEIIKNANKFMSQFENSENEEKLQNDVIKKYFEKIKLIDM